MDDGERIPLKFLEMWSRKHFGHAFNVAEAGRREAADAVDGGDYRLFPPATLHQATM
jgi:hypothetical protein